MPAVQSPGAVLPSASPHPAPALEPVQGSATDTGISRGLDPVAAGTYEPGHAKSGQHSALVQSFGYFEDSDFNTFALLRTLSPEDEARSSSEEMTPSIMAKVQQDLRTRMPPRHVLDFLVQYFVSELNWMKQLIHPPSFLPQYQQWWNKAGALDVADVEFAVLMLRVCSYAAQFLPSPSRTVDAIGGLSLAEIRNASSALGDDLACICVSLDWKGSLVRVQHVLFRAMNYSCQGRTDKFWEGIGCASRAAQKVGIHKNVPVSNDGLEHMEKELGRRVFCCLYVLDRFVLPPHHCYKGLADPRLLHAQSHGTTVGSSSISPERFDRTVVTSHAPGPGCRHLQRHR
nr:putative transcription factor sol4 [Quercus suber]